MGFAAHLPPRNMRHIQFHPDPLHRGIADPMHTPTHRAPGGRPPLAAATQGCADRRRRSWCARRQTLEPLKPDLRDYAASHKHAAGPSPHPCIGSSIRGGETVTAPVVVAFAVVPGGAPCRCTSTLTLPGLWVCRAARAGHLDRVDLYRVDLYCRAAGARLPAAGCLPHGLRDVRRHRSRGCRNSRYLQPAG